MTTDRLSHLFVEGFFATEKYTAKQGFGPDYPLPARDRSAHGNSVKSQLEKIRGENEQKRGNGTTDDEPAPISIEVRSERGYFLNLDSLENKAKGIEVACVRTEGDIQIATVQVPEGSLTHFLKVTEKYINEETPGTSKTPPKPKHQDLIARVAELRLATLRSFWTDEEANFPAQTQQIWWEVWVRKLGGQNIWNAFRVTAESTGVGLTVGKDTIEFPDRVVGLVFGTAEQLMASTELLDMIGEVRGAKENPADFIAMTPQDQAEWVNNFLRKIEPPPTDAPAVCLLDGLFDQSKFPAYEPIAPVGDLSPCSTTSLPWDKPWPYKPDIVLEGGNQIVLKGTKNVMDPDDMGLLTTAHATSGRLLVGFRDTSAATAQAARMGAILQAQYPKLWPETTRALLIHSAEWTEPMCSVFGDRKRDHASRLRRYGYGIPNLERALYSAKSSLTLLVQQKIQPFTKEAGTIKTKDMGFHSLPWPNEQLSELGSQIVTMRVTLSYFIEPKPGRREGFVKHRHRYLSHGLRFEVRRPTETTIDQFRKRISQAARDEEEDFKAVGDTAGWELGPQLRTRGSIHSDWWTGTAADLANCGLIAVYPVSGWWRESKGNDWSKEARYALVVTIRTNPVPVAVSLFTPTEVDLYTPVETTIKTAVPTQTTIEIEDTE